MQQTTIRYGKIYYVILAIVLPCLLIVPFVFGMQAFRYLDEWKIWLIIFAFLGIVIGLSLGLVLRAYRKCTLIISQKEVSLSFEPSVLNVPESFSFKISDILSFKCHEFNGAEYYVIKTQGPERKFHIFPVSGSAEDIIAFNEAVLEIDRLMRENTLSGGH